MGRQRRGEPSPLGRRLREAREAAGLSQAKLAAAIGIEKGSIWDLEAGHTQTMRDANLQRAAEALGVSTAWLLSGFDPSPADGQRMDIRTWARNYGELKSSESLRFLEESYQMLLELERSRRPLPENIDS